MNKKVTAIILVVVMILSFTLPVSAATVTQLDAAKSLLTWAGYTEADAQEAGGWIALIEETELVPWWYPFYPNRSCSNTLYELMRRRAVELYNIKQNEPTEPSVPETTEPTEPVPVITITQQPVGADVLADELYILSVSASVNNDAELSYQWYQNDMPVPGATGPSLRASVPMAATLNYYCVISAEGAKSVCTDTVVIQVSDTFVTPIITITKQPVGGDFFVGDSVALTIEATANIYPALQYQWYMDDTAIPDSNNPTLDLYIPIEGTFTFYCIVSAEGAEPVRSSDAVIHSSAVPVTPEITITEQPADLIADLGSEAVLTVSASCSTDAELRYQWYKNGSAISGATASSYSVPTNKRGTDNYYCVISAEGAESVTTDTVHVKVRVNMVFEDGLAQPILTYTSGKSSTCNNAANDIVRYCVYVETDYDTDSDGKLDLIKVLIQMPRAAMEGDYQAPVIYEARPYVAGTTGNVSASSGSYDINKLYTQVAPRTANGSATTAEVVAGANYTDWYYSYGYENLDWYDYFLVRGYAVVTAAGPGTYGSEGFETCGSDLEIDAFATVIEWLEGTQGRAAYTDKTNNISIEADWSNGQVGMTGRSYAGTTQFGLATTGVKGLETVVPVAGIASWYEYVCSQGIPTRSVGYTDYLAGYCASRALQSSDWSKISTNYRKYLKQLDTDEKALNGDYGNHWAVRDYTVNADNIECSALIVHGLNDSNVRPKNTIMMYNAFRQAGADVRLLLTQDSHRTPAYGSKKTEMLIDGQSYHDILNQWFTYHLCDEMTEVVDTISPVTVQNNTDGSWSCYDSWESAEQMNISFSPNKQISSGTTTTAKYVAGNTSYSVVQTVSVPSDLTIKGTVAVTIEATPGTSGQNQMLSAMLVDVSSSYFNAYMVSGEHVPTTTVKTDGIDIGGGAEPYDIVALKQSSVKQKVIAAGWMDLANPNAGYDSASAVNTGKSTTTRNTYTIYLQPNVYTVKAGHTLALVIYTRDSSVSTTSTSYKVTIHSANAEIPLA